MTLAGLYVPLITPFDESGAVALGALESLANEVLDAGARGVVALGTTAEPATLTAAEQRSVTDVAARVSGERGAQLLVGAHTRAELAALGGRPGVTAALSVVPPFIRPGEAGVLAHFAALAAGSPVPLVVYDVPYRTGQYLSADALTRLAAVPGVAGLKYAPGGINADTMALLASPPPGLRHPRRRRPVHLPAARARRPRRHPGLGPRGHGQLRRAGRPVGGGRRRRGPALGGPLSALSRALFAEPNPAVIKAVLHAQGRIPTPAVRLPLLPARPDTTAAALRCLAQVSTAQWSAAQPSAAQPTTAQPSTMPG